MTIQRKLFISLLIATTVTFAPTPAQAQGGFFKRLLGGAAEMVVPGTGGLIHAIGDEIDGTNDRIRQEEIDRKTAEAHERSEEVRREVRAQVEAEFRAEQQAAQEAQRAAQEAQRAQTQPTPQRSTPAGDSFNRMSRAGAEKACANSTNSSAAYQACVRSKMAAADAVGGTQAGEAINRLMDAFRGAGGGEGDQMFQLMLEHGRDGR